MNTQSIEQYIKLRAELEGEIIDVEGQIADHQLMVAQLETYREQLQKALSGEIFEDKGETGVEANTPKKTSVVTNSGKLTAFLKERPGSDRREIQGALGLGDNELKNLMDRMRKDGLIVNHGNRRHAQYYVTGNNK